MLALGAVTGCGPGAPLEPDATAQSDPEDGGDRSDPGGHDDGGDHDDAGNETAQQDGVTRLAGAGRIATAVALSRHAWAGAQTVVIASAADFPDALAAGALAAARSAPILLTHRQHLPELLAGEVERLAAPEVLVVGGPGAVAEEVLEGIRALRHAPVVERVAGDTRFSTAAEVARRTAGPGGELLVASGLDFPDAVTAGSLLAGDEPAPMLLVTADAVPEATRAALEELRPSAIRILGGERVVGPEVEAVLRAQADEVSRLAGADRYATAVQVLTEALERQATAGGRPLITTTGEHFPDALAAGALAARLDGLVLLVPQRRLTDGLDSAVRAHAERFSSLVVVGGDGAVGNHALAELDAALAGAPRPGFAGSAGPLPPQVRERMAGVSWREGCPVGLDDLAYLELVHWDFRGQVRQGELVVGAHAAQGLLAVFERLFDAGFPLAQVRLVDDFGGDDDASMAANNTSAFNCRTVGGTSRWSEHAFGTAIDLNPVQNPYVAGGGVAPPAGEAYLDRGDVRPGMIVRPGPVTEAFEALGWGWGGDWSSSKDYQHFSASGR